MKRDRWSFATSQLDCELLDLVDTGDFPIDTDEGVSYANFIKKADWLKEGEFTNKVVIVGVRGLASKAEYKEFVSKADEDLLAIGVLRKTKTPRIYFQAKHSKEELVKRKEKQLKRKKISDNIRGDPVLKEQSLLFQKNIEKDPRLKNFFSNMTRCSNATYKNDEIDSVSNLAYIKGFIQKWEEEKNKNLSGIKSLSRLNWRFRDQDLEEWKNGTIESRYFLQRNCGFYKNINFFGEEEPHNVYVVDELLGNQAMFEKFCDEFDNINILAAFQEIIDLKIVDNFPEKIEERFSKYINF